MQIQQLSSYFERIERTSLRNEITSLLSDLFSRASVKEIDKICYLTMGRLAPPYVGINFNIADKTMMKMIAFAYGVKEDEVKRAFSQKGDLGEVAEFYARKKHTKKTPSPSMKEVYTLLLELATTSGTGSQDVKIQKFASLMKQLDPLSVRFVVRIPVGKLRLGFSDMTILDSLSWMVKKDKSFRKPLEDAYNISSDIGKIATVCKEKGEKGIRTMGVEVGIPIRTAAAERLPSAAAIIKKLGTCAAEPKYDGFRVQIHIDSSKKSEKGDLPLFPGEKPSAWVRLYSRNLENTTQMFPEIVKAAQRLPGKKIVIEGEAIAFNPETEEFLPFQETAQRKRKYGIDQKAKDLPLKVFLFDLLYLDGTSYIDSPYSQRRKKLEALVEHSRQDTLLLATEQIFHDTKALERFFQAMITQGLEGIMVKKLDAPYQAGSRNFNWVKLKREEKGELEDTLDCVVLGYYYGRGKRASLEGKVWLGIRMLKQASKILESVGEDVEFFEGQIKDTNELKSLLQNEIQKTMELLKGFTLSVKVLVNILELRVGNVGINLSGSNRGMAFNL